MKEAQGRRFNIFQVYQYFTIYRWYFFIKIWKKIYEYLIQHYLKSGGTERPILGG